MNKDLHQKRTAESLKIDGTAEVGLTRSRGWSHARRLNRLCYGVDRENVPTYLDRYEFRYNRRDEHPLREALQTGIIQGLLP